MNTSNGPMATAAAAQSVRVTDRALVVELRDGRVVSVPLTWYPRLAEASRRERKRWELLGPGIGIHWPELDEDISVEGLLAGARQATPRRRSTCGGNVGGIAVRQTGKAPTHGRGHQVENEGEISREIAADDRRVAGS